ncbi:hypothetical protein [Vibrio quintilis]|uniref:Uncharacterized protein n=1 Tax=Vibrio quintilis TaxID=1117707 RepID=A0A1M7YVR6_9VIBR|nr:hypothetical protein [Vibrio quintilis]SHO56704.1 hypothetical protein VQ7734_02473 [Vibrio quintilis]
MHSNDLPENGITVEWASPHQPEGHKLLDIEYESQSGLSFEQAIDFVKNFDWQQELDKLNQGEGTSGLSLKKADSEEDIMHFSLLPLDKDAFIVELTIVNRSRRQGFWDKADASIDLGICSMDELEEKLLPLGECSIAHLYDQYREQGHQQTKKERIALLIYLIIALCIVGFCIGQWIDPLMSPAFEKLFWPSLLYIGGPLSALFLALLFFSSNPRQTIKEETPGTQLFIIFGLIISGPMSLFFLVKGVAVPIHMMISEPSTQIEQVSGKSDDWYGHGRGSCDGKLWLRSSSDPSTERLLCDVPKSAWQGITIGDTLLLEGMGSPIALSVKKISVLSNRNEKISD